MEIVQINYKSDSIPYPDFKTSRVFNVMAAILLGSTPPDIVVCNVSSTVHSMVKNTKALTNEALKSDLTISDEEDLVNLLYTYNGSSIAKYVMTALRDGSYANFPNTYCRVDDIDYEHKNRLINSISNVVYSESIGEGGYANIKHQINDVYIMANKNVNSLDMENVIKDVKKNTDKFVTHIENFDM